MIPSYLARTSENNALHGGKKVPEEDILSFKRKEHFSFAMQRCKLTVVVA